METWSNKEKIYNISEIISLYNLQHNECAHLPHGINQRGGYLYCFVHDLLT